MKSFMPRSDQLLRVATLTCFAMAAFFAVRALQPTGSHVLPTAAAESGAGVQPAIPAAGESPHLNSDGKSKSAPSSTSEPVTQNIEDIRLGQRVVGTNPLREQTQHASEIDPATWRTVRLTMVQHGVEYDLAFLRPLSWIETTGSVVGHSIYMKLHEMGLDGPAEIVAIDPCPEIEADDGTGRNVVTGTMSHPAPNILNLAITGLEEPLGVTDTHPIWSETRHDFVAAGQLQIGEQFRTLTGQPAALTAVHRHRGPPATVYNLEVNGEHVYSVGNSGLLVHNEGCVPTIPAYVDGTTIAPIQGRITTTTEGIWSQIGNMLAEKQSRHVGTISRNREEAEALARQIAAQNGISSPTLRFDASDARGFWPHFHIEDMPMNLHFWWPK